MQAFKLVNGGYVDRVIVFDELPERLLQGIRTRELSGFPRSWARWLASIGSTRPVMRTETTQHPDRSLSFKYTPIGKEPCFYILEYQDINADKEKWREISEFIRTHVTPDVRLKEKIEDMALQLAPNPNAPMSDIEPETDLPIIPIPPEVPIQKPDDEVIEQGETILVDELKKKRGRPKKMAVEA